MRETLATLMFLLSITLGIALSTALKLADTQDRLSNLERFIGHEELKDYCDEVHGTFNNIDGLNATCITSKGMTAISNRWPYMYFSTLTSNH